MSSRRGSTSSAKGAAAKPKLQRRGSAPGGLKLKARASSSSRPVPPPPRTVDDRIQDEVEKVLKGVVNVVVRRFEAQAGAAGWSSAALGSTAGGAKDKKDTAQDEATDSSDSVCLISSDDDEDSYPSVSQWRRSRSSVRWRWHWLNLKVKSGWWGRG